MTFIITTIFFSQFVFFGWKVRGLPSWFSFLQTPVDSLPDLPYWLTDNAKVCSTIANSSFLAGLLTLAFHPAELGFSLYFFNLFSVLLVGTAVFVSFKYFGWKADWFDWKAGEGSTEHLRGGKLLGMNELHKASVKESRADPNGGGVALATASIPFSLENRHFLFAGSTGSGKSQAFYQVAEKARERGDSAVVPDTNGEFTSRFYREGVDVLLSPHDRRAPAWSPLAEMTGTWDAERIAKSIIPDGEGSGAEWNHYSQVLLTAILLKTWKNNGDNGDLAQAILYSNNQELGELVRGTPAQMQFAEGADKMLASIRAILASYTSWLSDLKSSAGGDAFSISKFVKNAAENGAGEWLFFPVRDDQFKSLRSLISAQIDIAISALLSSEDDEDRRVWFFVDEFASWGRIESIEPLLTKARKKGGVGVLGMQSISQVRDSYGMHKSQTILANCGTWLTLRAGDAETAEYMSKNIGDEEIRRTLTSTSKQGESESEQYTKQRAIMPSELQSLTDLCGILNVVGNLPAGWVQVPISSLQKISDSFLFEERQSSPQKANNKVAEMSMDFE